jgi:hypothetical protein
MIRSLKAAFGLSLLAALTMTAISGGNASAINAGANNHFVSEAASTFLDISEATGSVHATQFTGWGTTISCHHPTYSAPEIGTTTQEITVTPDYKNCTTGSNAVATVDMNGCHYKFTAPGAGTHATVHFICGAGKFAQITTGGGTMTLHPQTPTIKGVTYTKIVDAGTGKHGITVNVTVEGLHGTCHGACQILGTTRTDAKMTGSVTVWGTNAEGKTINITAT